MNKLQCLTNRLVLVSLFVILSIGPGCKSLSKSVDEPDNNKETPNPKPTDPDKMVIKLDKDHFAIPDGALFNYGRNRNLEVKALFDKGLMKKEDFMALPPLVITDDEYAEIKEFTDKEIVKGAKGMEAYKRIFKWVSNNIKHTQSDNNPYAVFKNRIGICYGYSNLTKTMLLTQGFPCLVMTGYLGQYGAHSWNYAYVDGQWLVVDTTNRNWKPMKNTGEYSNLKSTLIPRVIFSNKLFDFNFDNGLNIYAVKSTEGSSLSIPYSYKGFIISTFSPREMLPSTVKELYISDNITDMGENVYGLSKYEQSLEAIHVKPSNPNFESYKGAPYYKGQDEPAYIPYMKKSIELKPIAKVGKNIVVNRPNLEEVIFSEKTLEIGSDAVENCPKVKRIVISKDAKVDPNAFVKVAEDVEIVRK